MTINYHNRYVRPTETVLCLECGQPLTWTYSAGSAQPDRGTWLLQCLYVDFASGGGFDRLSCGLFGCCFRRETYDVQACMRALDQRKAWWLRSRRDRTDIDGFETWWKQRHVPSQLARGGDVQA